MEGFSQLTPFILLLVVVYFIYTLLKADKKGKSTPDEKIKSLSEIYSKDNISNSENNKTDNDMKRNILRIANNSKIIANIMIFWLITSFIAAIYILMQ
jgi:hypothetical protein